MVLKFRRKGTFWPFKQCTPLVKHFSLFWLFIGKGKIEWCYSDSQPFDCIYSSSWWPLIWSLCRFTGSATHAAFIQRINWIRWIRRVTLSSTMCLATWGFGSPCFFRGGLAWVFFNIPEVFVLAYPGSCPRLCFWVSADSIFNDVTWCQCIPGASETSLLSLKKTNKDCWTKFCLCHTGRGSCWVPVRAVPTCKSATGLINLRSCIEAG